MLPTLALAVVGCRCARVRSHAPKQVLMLLFLVPKEQRARLFVAAARGNCVLLLVGLVVLMTWRRAVRSTLMGMVMAGVVSPPMSWHAAKYVKVLAVSCS